MTHEGEMEEMERNSIDLRLDTLEQHWRDMMERYQEILNRLDGFSQDLEMLTARMNQMRPPVKNCPKCGRKVMSRANKCATCSHSW